MARSYARQVIDMGTSTHAISHSLPTGAARRVASAIIQAAGQGQFRKKAEPLGAPLAAVIAQLAGTKKRGERSRVGDGIVLKI